MAMAGECVRARNAHTGTHGEYSREMVAHNATRSSGGEGTAGSMKQISWQAVTLLLGGGVLFTLIVLFAPLDVRQWLLGANGLVFCVLGLLTNWRKPGRLSDPDRTPTDPGA